MAETNRPGVGHGREVCTVELLGAEGLTAQLDKLEARDREDYVRDVTHHVAALVVSDEHGALDALRECFAMWRLRLSLEASPVWQDQVAAGERRAAAGEMGDPIGIDDLPRLFPVD